MKMKKRLRNPMLKPDAPCPITEKDLLKNFEKYQKLVDNLKSQYPSLFPETLDEAQEPIYVSEPIFFYRVTSVP